MPEAEHCRVGIVLVIHAAQVGIGVQHVPLCLHATIHREPTAHAEPIGSLARLDLNRGIGHNLLEHILPLAHVKVEPALEQVNRPKGAHMQLVTRDGSQMIRACLLDCLRKS